MSHELQQKLLNILSTKNALKTRQVLSALGVGRSRTHDIRCTLYSMQSRQLCFFNTLNPRNAGWVLTPTGVRARSNPNLL